MALRVAIIGGSLAGLAAAHALTRAGCAVQVFERASAGFETRGGGLGIDLALARAVTASGEPPPHLVLPRRQVWRDDHVDTERVHETVTSYGALWCWLATRLAPGTLVLGRPVNALAPRDDGIDIAFADGAHARFDFVVCADGGQGASFDWLPRGLPRYAGYVLWRGLCALRDVPGRSTLENTLNIAGGAARHLVAYPVPDYDGATAFTMQFANWGCYVPTPEHEALRLRAAGGRTLVPHALERGAPDAWVEAVSSATADFPSWVNELVAATVRQGMIAPHPIFELVPRQLHGPRVALVGDCAHVASPITGSGARMAFLDAMALGKALSDTSSVDDALAAYAAIRKDEARMVVARGQAFGAALVAGRR